MNRKRFICHILFFAYMHGLKDGFIALWKDGNPEPIRVFPYLAEFLPPEDQNALQQGIRIDNKPELVHILEDYLS